jgi:2-keto-3-deoxy-L-rhamnonate aldolase RhmA
MSILINHALERLRAGKSAWGFGVSHFRSVAAAHVAQAAGFHWLTVDLEHGVTPLADAAQICMAASAIGISPIVRIAPGAHLDGTRLLDNGAQGVLVPDVRSAEQARSLVCAFRYPPRGKRAWGANTFPFGYRAPPVEQAMHQVDDQMLLAVMIESLEGIEAVDEIASVDGIDVVFIGASDLAGALGARGRAGGASLQAAIEHSARACSRAGKVLGLGGVHDPDDLKKFIRCGARFVAGGNDLTLLLSAATYRASCMEQALAEVGS